MTISRKTLILTASIAGSVALVTIGAGAAYASYYSDRALPGTQIGEYSLAGMNRTELISAINERAEQSSLTAEVAGTSQTLTLKELGVTVDAEKTADSILASNQSLLSRFTALTHRTEVVPVYADDQDVVKQLGASLALHAGPAVVNAQVQPDTSTGQFTSTIASPGKGIDQNALNEAVTNVATHLSAETVALQAVDLEPVVSTEEAANAAQQANTLIAPTVSVSDGIDSFTAEPAQKVTWVSIKETNDGLEAPTIDRAKVDEWVQATAQATNVAPKNGVNNVDAAGNVLVEALPGTKGLSVNNAAAVTDEVVSALGQARNYEGKFSYDDVAPQYDSRPALPGHENYRYPAAEGEKWVDIDLTRSTLTAYEGHTVVRGPVAINHGGPGHETVTGTYHVYLKYASQDMGCTPEWPYCAKDVPWVSYFTGSYAMHGAPWVGQFGIGSDESSHGCINMPVSEAHWMWSWNDMGTAVVTHY